MKKGINLSDTIMSEEDKKKAEELAKPKAELTAEQKEKRKKAKKERQEIRAVSKEPYLINIFRMKDKPSWRMTMENPFPNIENVAEIKTIRIDRTTGEVI